MAILTHTKKYFQESRIGIFISALNVFLLWLLIDIFHVKTVIASVSVIGLTFIIRYVLYDSSKML